MNNKMMYCPDTKQANGTIPAAAKMQAQKHMNAVRNEPVWVQWAFQLFNWQQKYNKRAKSIAIISISLVLQVKFHLTFNQIYT